MYILPYYFAQHELLSLNLQGALFVDIRFQAGGPTVWKGQVMLTFACKGEDPSNLCAEIGDATPWFTIAPGLKDFDGSKGQLATFHGHPDQAIPRVVAVGLGEREKFSLAGFRNAVASAATRCRNLGVESVLIPVPVLEALPADTVRLVEEAICAVMLGLYRFMTLKEIKPDHKKDPKWLALGFAEKSVPDAEHKAARRGEHAAQGICLARDLANTPPNIMTPKALAKAAQNVAKQHGMKYTVLDAKELAKIGCNAMLAVGQGSSNPPCLAIVEHAPKGHENDDPIILVGKGLTFDSGGISLKPAANMHTMKSDMSGAAAIVGALHAAGQDDIQRRIIAVLACAENMPSSKAMRPGDVVKSHSGKTIEILNTDAEGRLVLCDALSYAQEQWTPACIIDIATLTGACAIALGQELAGLFTDDKTLGEELLSIGSITGDNYWQLPLWDNYNSGLKSHVADIAHLGPREGGAIHAALFLKNFIKDDVRWAHLDIAGADWASKPTALCPVGAIGFGARSLLEIMRSGV